MRLNTPRTVIFFMTIFTIQEILGVEFSGDEGSDEHPTSYVGTYVPQRAPNFKIDAKKSSELGKNIPKSTEVLSRASEEASPGNSPRGDNKDDIPGFFPFNMEDDLPAQPGINRKSLRSSGTKAESLSISVEVRKSVPMPVSGRASQTSTPVSRSIKISGKPPVSDHRQQRNRTASSSQGIPAPVPASVMVTNTQAKIHQSKLETPPKTTTSSQSAPIPLKATGGPILNFGWDSDESASPNDSGSD